MDKWEYMTIQLQPKTMLTGKLLKQANSSWDANYFSEQLNRYGQQGWELVSCFATEGAIQIALTWHPQGTNGVFASFKRRVE